MRRLLQIYHGFTQDNCGLRASSLTFYTLLSIVPLAAMAFGLAKGFALEVTLEKQLLSHFHAQQDVVKQVITFARNLLDNTQGGIIAGVGVASLLWSVSKLLGHVEDAFNKIWSVAQPRSLMRRFTNYLAIILVSPFLLIVSASATTLVKAQTINYLGAWVTPLLNFSSLFSISMLMTLLFIIIPNTKVSLKSGAVAGIITGCTYQAFQWLYVTFQAEIGSYGIIYGSFAALPLFLLWLQISWLIVLAGAEVAFHFQFPHALTQEISWTQLSIQQQRLFTIRTMELVAKRYGDGEGPTPLSVLQEELDIPYRLLKEGTQMLMSAELLTEVADKNAFLPARDTHSLTYADILYQLETSGEAPLLRDNPAQDRLDSFHSAITKTSANKKV